MKSSWWPGSSGIKNFQSREFRDGILQNPGIPGFFGTGLAWNFIPGFYQKKSTGPLGVSFSVHKFGQCHTFWRTYLFVKYNKQTKVSSIPSCGKQQEKASVQCCWQCGDWKRVCLAPEKVEACVIVKSNLGLVRDMGFRMRSKYLVNWLVPSCVTKTVTISH